MQIRTGFLVRCLRKTGQAMAVPFTIRLLWPLLFALFFVAPSFGQTLTQVTIAPTDTVAGKGTVYTVSFITSLTGVGLPGDGQVRLTFPAGFGVSTVVLAGPATPANGITGGFNSPTVVGQIVTVRRDGTGAAVVPGDTAVFKIAVATNPVTAGNYALTVATLTSAGAVIDTALSTPFRIGVGPLAFVKVLTGSNGNTPEVVANTITADQNISMHAGGFDALGNYRNDVSVNWSVSGGIGVVSPASGIATTFSANKIGNGQITADHPTAGVIDGVSGNLHVVPGALNKVFVVAGPAGEGTPLGAYTMTTDQTLLVHASAYDSDNNYIQDEPVTWTMNNPIGTLAPATGNATTFDAKVPGTVMITADHATLLDGATGFITVNIGADYRIKILSGLSGQTPEVLTNSLNSGQTVTVHASIFDADDNWKGDVSVGWTVTGGIGTVAPANGISTIFTAQKAGTGVINADHATLLDDATGDITVGAGPLAKVKIVQGSFGDGTEMGAATFTTDNSPVVHAAGYDANDNYVGDQVVAWSVSGGIGSVFPSAGTSTTLTLTTPGSGNIIATHASVTGDVAGPITVTEGSPYRVKVLTNTSGNTPEVTAQTLTAGSTLAVHAGSFDADGHYVGDVPVTWNVSGNIGTFTPASAISTTLTATTPGNGVFTADHATLVDGVSPTITVTAGSLSFVKVVEGTSGNGAELTTKSLSTDQNLTVHAAGYDAAGVYLGDFSVTWSVSFSGGANGTLAPTTGASTTFNPTRIGTAVITANHATATDDVTGNVTITNGAAHHVKVLPNASGSGTEVGSQSVPAGQTLVVHASSFDADDNRIGDVSVNWLLSGGIGTVFPTSGISTTFTATTAGTGTITADHATLFDDATGTITVTAGILTTVKIVEGASGIGPEMGSKSLTTDNSLIVHAAGYDANGNYVGDQSVTWSVSGSIGSVSPITGISTTLTLTTPGSGIITADHASATDDVSGTINVATGVPHHVKILSAAFGPTLEIDTATLQVGDPLLVHAGSFDADDNYSADVSVTWNVTGAIGNLSSVVNTTTTLTAQKVGTGTITADHPTLIDDATGTITVTAGSLFRVRIVEGESGNGLELTDKTVSTDESLNLHAAGYDAADNYLGDFPVNWSVTNSIGIFSVANGPTTRLNLTTVGQGVITADHATANDDQSGTIDVIAGAAHHIKILSGASGNNSPVDAQSVPTGANLVMHAGSFDADENYKGDVSVAWNVSGVIGNVTPSAGISTTFTATTAGTGTVIATHGTLGDDPTGIITVTNGTLSSVRIVEGGSGPGSQLNTKNLTTDQPLTVHAAGYDVIGNYIGDFSVNWSVSNGIGVMNPTLSAVSTFDPRTPGVGVITADYPTAGVTDDVTGNITVTVGVPNRIKVLSGTNGETPDVTTVTLTAGDILDVHAGGYDADGNFTGNEPASWTVSGGIGTVAPAVGITTRLTTTTAGTGVISADHATLIDDATGTITVNAGSLSYIKIVEGPSGKGLELTTKSLTTDQTLTVHAAGYDAAGNYLDDYPVNWSVSNSIGALSSATGISTTLEANKPGIGIITADHATATDDVTGNITVTTGAPHRVKILSGLTGLTTEIGDSTMLTGGTLIIHAGSYDRDDNHIGDVSASWNVSGSIGALNPLSGISTTFTANTAGTGVITATTPTLIADLSGTITVQAGSVNYIKIVEGPPGINGPELGNRSASTDETITVHAAGYDLSGNYLGDFPVNWSVSNNIGVLSATTNVASTQLNLRTPGPGKIFADHATAADDSSGTITVGVGALHSVKVYTGLNGKTGEVANVSLNAGQTYIVHAAGFDADGNYRGDEPVDWSLTISRIASLSPLTGVSTTLTARKVGTTQIKADHATAQDGLSGSITVSAGALAFIQAIEGPSGNGTEMGARTITADDVLQLHAAGFDADTNYVGDQVVNWSSAGNLTPTVSATGAASIAFAPTLAPASGTIRATHAVGFDETGTITVTDGALRKIKILSGLANETSEVNAATVPSGGTLQVHAAGYDGDDNYISDRSVSWTLTNPIGTLNPASGLATTFTAGAQGNTTIRAVDGALEDNTGIITVTTSSVAKIILRTAPGVGGLAGGVPYGLKTITADEQTTVYAAAYDAGNNYLGEVSVNWTNTGNLAPAVSATGPAFTFSPTLAAADNSVNGLIIGTYSPTIKDSTGAITVLPGAPSGTITLTPNPNALAADGNATSTINSGDIQDGDGNSVGGGKLFTITINPALGVITTSDADPLPGHQIATNPVSRLSFVFKAGLTGGLATITATGGGGAANGSTSISLGSLSIENISTAPATVSQGQTGITVSMQVRNLSTATVTNLTGALDFVGSANRNVDYVVQTPAPVTLAGNATATLSFIVAVNNNAATEAVTINGTVQGAVGAATVSANGTTQTDSWMVQRPAKLTIQLTTSADDTVAQGQLNRSVTVRIANDPGAATANVDSVRLVFKQGPANITADYLIAPPNGPASIAASATADYTFSLNVGAAATLGLVTIDARAYGKDANSNQQISDLNATTPHSWTVVAGNAFRIVSLTPSQSKVTANMAGATRSWTAQMALQNAGTSPIRLNFAPAKTFIRLTIGSQNVTSEYTITSPTALDGGGTTLNGGAVGTLTFVITRTGNTRGIATISGVAEATDIPTNQTVQDNTNDGGAGQVEVQSPPIFRVESLQLSQATVTQNMAKDWRLKAVVRNDGEADLRLHPSPDSIKISIGNNAGYIFSKSALFASGDSILTRGETDSLFVFVTQTGSALGPQNVALSLKGRDRNSFQLLNSNASNTTVNVQSPSVLSILSVTPSQTKVSVGQTNAWAVTVVARNSGGSLTALKTDSTNLRFRLGTAFQNDYTVALEQPRWLGSGTANLAANTIDSLRFVINTTGGANGTVALWAKVGATEINSDVIRVASNNVSSVLVQQLPNVSYIANSMLPDVVNNNTLYAFTVRVRNGANRATVLLDPASTKFLFNNGGTRFEATLDANNPVKSIAPGDTTLTFAATAIPAAMPAGTYTPQIQLRGTQNGNAYSANLNVTPNELTVALPARVQVLAVRPSQNTVTANMAKSWNAIVTVRNNGGSGVQLDSVKLQLVNGNDVTADFGFSIPNTFLGSSTAVLNAGEMDSLRFDFNRTGSLPGGTALQASLFVKDQSNGQPIVPPPAGSGSVVVQSRAIVTILNLAASRTTVTRNQTQPWTVDMNLRNAGGSDVQLDFTNTRLTLSNGGTISAPDTLLNGNRILTGNTEATARFTITPTGSLIGRNDITGQVRGTELNSGDIRSDDTADGGATFVTVQDSAKLRVKSVVLKGAPNLPNVNISQAFAADVVIENFGEEAADTVRVNFSPAEGSTVTPPVNRQITTIPGGQTRALSFDMTAANAEDLDGEVFRASIIAGKARNTGATIVPSPAPDDTGRVFIQRPAGFQITRVIPSETRVEAGQSTRWFIDAVVTNNGGAAMVLNKPSAADITVQIGGATQIDYTIQADTLLRRTGTRQLAAGEIDTVRYIVRITGSQRGGQASLRVDLSGRDKNNNAALSGNATGQIEVTTTAAVQLVTTSPEGIRKVGELGFVNVNQNFNVEVKVQNISPFERVENVRVQLFSDLGRSIIADGAVQVIDSIKTREERFAIFSVLADTTNPAAQQNETFTARIISAVTRSGQPAVIRQGVGDSTAQVLVQRPANLSVAATISEPSLILSSNQVFDFKTYVTNLGQSAVDDFGEVTLNLPPGFSFEPGNPAVRTFKVRVPADTVLWKVRAPGTAATNADLQVAITKPAKDLNRDAAAAVSKAAHTVRVSVVPTDLKINRVYVSSPAGAADRTVSTDQTFTVNADLVYSLDLTRTDVKLRVPAPYRQVSPNPPFSDFVSWQVQAPNDANEIPLFLVVRATGYDRSGQLVERLDSLSVVTVEKADLTLDARITNPPGSVNGNLALGQIFTVTAALQKNGRANVIDTAKVALELRNGFTTTDVSEKIIDANGQVQWQVTAPNARITDSLTVRLTRRPFDENTNAVLDIPPSRRFRRFPVSTDDPGFVQVISWSIISPLGAADSVVSTGQFFNVRAQIDGRRARNVTAELKLPLGFPPVADALRRFDAVNDKQNIDWVIQAPSASSNGRRDTLHVELTGFDDRSGQPILRQRGSLRVETVDRAQLELRASITEPLTASQGGNVGLNTLVTITARVENLGRAAIRGGARIRLRLPDDPTLPPAQDYRTSEDSIKTADATGVVSWQFRARSLPSTRSETINLRLLIPYPNDENRDVAADVLDNEVSIPIQTERKRLTVQTLPAAHGPVVRGETGSLMLRLKLTNESNINASNILLRALLFHVLDRNNKALNAGQVIKELRVVDTNNPTRVLARLTPIPAADSLRVLFAPTADTLRGASPQVVDVVADIADNSSEAFRLVFKRAADVEAIDQDSGDGVEVIFKDERGNDIAASQVVSSKRVVAEADFQKAFYNYPNPFDPDAVSDTHPNGGTYFNYMLTQAADVEFRIYTLLGELVFAKSYTSADPEGRPSSSPKRLFWDGRNGNGARVLNGVYLAMLKVSGNTATTKVAVLKK